MKRLIIASIIFALTVAFCISGFYIVTSKGEQMTELLVSCANKVDNNPNAPLTEIAEQINKEWSKHSTLFKSVFIHNDFSEIETLLNQLKVFAKQGSSDSFSECCNEAISRLRYALDNEKPKIQNIF